MPAVPASPTAAASRLRHRRNARTLTAGQLADFREAVTAAQGIRDVVPGADEHDVLSFDRVRLLTYS